MSTKYQYKLEIHYFLKLGLVNVGSGTFKLFSNKLKIVPSKTSFAFIITSSMLSPSVKQDKNLWNLHKKFYLLHKSHKDKYISLS